MDDLIDAFNRGANVETVDKAVLVDGKVFAQIFIPACTSIGQLPGVPAYIWEMHHPHYIFIDDDRVLDVSQLEPRPTLSFIRDDDESDAAANCVVDIRETYGPDVYTLSFWLMSTRPILPGEEIVYHHHR